MKCQSASTENRIPQWRVLYSVLIVAFAALCLLHVWIVDDAYITLRQAEQLLAGHGFVWNAGERVQAYTHPLWALLMVPLFALTREGFWTLSTFSFLLTLIALTVARRALDHTAEGYRKLVFLGLLVPSKAFLDFTSSGLENALSYLLLFAFFGSLCATVDAQQVSQEKSRCSTSTCSVLKLSCIACLIYLNRADLILLVFPGIAYVLFTSGRKGRRRALVRMTIGFCPAIVWTIFTLFYYGEIIPNTAIAKISGARLTFGERTTAGLLYSLDSLVRDPYTLILSATTLVLFLRPGSKRGGQLAALGIAGYLLYVLLVGGASTHMSGRFFACVVGVAAFTIAREIRWPSHVGSGLTVAAAVAIALLTPSSPLRAVWTDGSNLAGDRVFNGIIDTRFYASREGAGILSAQLGAKLPNNKWYKAGLAFRHDNDSVRVGGPGQPDAIGYSGFASGPNKFIIDPLGLADPLLARIPATKSRPFTRPGHVQRDIPDGYVESIKYAENRISDPDLRAYYDVIRELTRGRLWSLHRFRRIALFKLGHYDYFLARYAARHELRAP